MNVQLVGDYGSDFHAGPKAQRDVTEILGMDGWQPFLVRRRGFHGVIGRVVNRLDWYFRVRMLRRKLPEDCVLFMQYPSAGWSKSPVLRLLNESIVRKKRIRLVVLIHDLSSLRHGKENFSDRKLSVEEADLMRIADVLIVHNESMLKALVRQGIAENKMVCLKMFDYLSDSEPFQCRRKDASVVIAGNLDPSKTAYLSGLSDVRDVEWNLYGVGFDPSRLSGDNVHFKGCYSPDELPAKLDGAFGLVWDGTSADTCAGDFGNYLRINNPHKLSLYLRAGLPVIVWREAAVAKFVQEQGVGVCVDSLKEIPERIAEIDEDSYAKMAAEARRVGKLLARGEFTRRAVEAAVVLTQRHRDAQRMFGENASVLKIEECL